MDEKTFIIRIKSEPLSIPSVRFDSGLIKYSHLPMFETWISVCHHESGTYRNDSAESQWLQRTNSTFSNGIALPRWNFEHQSHSFYLAMAMFVGVNEVFTSVGTGVKAWVTVRYIWHLDSARIQLVQKIDTEENCWKAELERWISHPPPPPRHVLIQTHSHCSPNPTPLFASFLVWNGVPKTKQELVHPIGKI